MRGTLNRLLMDGLFIRSFNAASPHQFEPEQASGDSAEKRDRLGNDDPDHVLELGVLDGSQARERERESCIITIARSVLCSPTLAQASMSTRSRRRQAMKKD